MKLWGNDMKKAVIFKTHSDYPYLDRAKINKGIVEYITPTSLSTFKHFPLTNIGKAVFDEAKKIHFEPKFKIIKRFFVAGAHKFWMSIETPKLKVIFKVETKSTTQTTYIKYCIVEAEGGDKEIEDFFNNIYEHIKKDLISDIILKDDDLVKKYLKKNKNVEIYNKL